MLYIYWWYGGRWFYLMGFKAKISTFIAVLKISTSLRFTHPNILIGSFFVASLITWDTLIFVKNSFLENLILIFGRDVSIETHWSKSTRTQCYGQCNSLLIPYRNNAFPVLLLDLLSYSYIYIFCWFQNILINPNSLENKNKHLKSQSRS